MTAQLSSVTRRIPPSTLLVVAVVIGLLLSGAVATIAAPDHRGPQPVEPTVVPVSETVVACPGLRSREGYTDSTVAAATPPRVAGIGEDATGHAKVSTLTHNPEQDQTLIRLSQPGDRGAYTGRNGERDSVTGTAVGSLAPGFSVSQTERTVDGRGRGLASTQCLPSGDDFWFVGAASQVGDQASLILTNPESAVATVNVDLYGKRGPVDAPGGRGVQVQPRSHVELSLTELAPGEPVLAVNVQVQVGRLSAAMTETDVFGREPRGTDWIPEAEPPSTRLVVPGIPEVAKGRESSVLLDLVAPDEPAVAKITLVTRDGAFVPLGHEVVDVPAGGMTSVDLTKSLRREAAAVLVESDAPVTAGARVVLKDPDLFGDTLFLAASRPFVADAVVPDNRLTKDLQTRLVLTAASTDAAVTVKVFAGTRSVQVAHVELAAQTTRTLTIRPPKDMHRFGLIVKPDPGSGPVYGVRMLDEQGARGPLVTSFPLRAARLVATVPEAVPDVVAGTVS